MSELFHDGTSAQYRLLSAKLRPNGAIQMYYYDRECSFLFQRISVVLHRFNSVLLHDSFVSTYCPD